MAIMVGLGDSQRSGGGGSSSASGVTYNDATTQLGASNVQQAIEKEDAKVAQIEADLGGLKFVKLTQAQYDALTTKDSSTLYVIA